MANHCCFIELGHYIIGFKREILPLVSHSKQLYISSDGASSATPIQGVTAYFSSLLHLIKAGIRFEVK